jgi:hypothetical protein
MGFVFFIVFAGIIFAMAAAHSRAVGASWESAAHQLGLTAKAGGFLTRPTLAGRIGAIDVHVRVVTRSKNNPYTVYAVRYPQRTRPFRLSREHVFSGFSKLFGAEDVVVGDHRFDSSFMVKADDPDALALYLTPSRRVELLGFAAANSSMIATESTVEATYRGAESRSDRLVTRVRRIVAVAEQLAEDDPLHADENEALLHRQLGDLELSARELQDIGLTRPTDYRTRIGEVEARVAAHDLENARTEIEELAAELPTDREVEGWRAEITATAAAPAPAGNGTGDVPPDEIIQDLFGTTKLSFETAERFRTRYKNREIDWQGVVHSVRDYATDHDFGEEPGVKAVVTVAEVEHDLYGNSTIDAVVQFPAGSTLRRDDVVAFTGRLIKIDPLMRNIYVANGTLVDD